jgi:3-methyladenine DNA glycosylase AlkD
MGAREAEVNGHLMATARELQRRLRDLGSPEAAALAARFFKTGPGQYGEGDIFLGIRVPALRKLAREHCSLPEDQILVLLRSEVHEDRCLALLILVLIVSHGDDAIKRRVYELYLAHTRHINNWDLVDASARTIVGGYLLGRSRRPLDRLARSRDVWERRISIVATHAFIVEGDHADTVRIAERLLGDPHDLIHKAAGWMLREVGKRDQPTLERFLLKHHRAMPRTMLRYAIERFPEERRKAYLQGTVIRAENEQTGESRPRLRRR